MLTFWKNCHQAGSTRIQTGSVYTFIVLNLESAIDSTNSFRSKIIYEGRFYVSLHNLVRSQIFRVGPLRDAEEVQLQ